MLQLFRINDPYRLLAVFFFLLLFRLPYMIGGVPLIIPELNWMVVGEAQGGGKMMYEGVWDDIGPLSAAVYWLLDMLFGRSQLAYQIISLFLVIIQAGIFNNLLLRNKAFNENVYVPSFVYILFMSLSFDFLTLSPVLMSMTLVLLGLNNLFRRIDNKTRDELFLNMGFYMGLASLFYLPTVLFFLAIWLSLVLFTGAIIRRVTLFVFGFVSIHLAIIFYMYLQNSLRDYFFNFYASVMSIPKTMFLSFHEVMLFCAIPLFYLLFSIFKMSGSGRYVNYQVKFQFVMLIMLVMGALSLLLTKRFSSYQLVALAPPLAFFVSHMLLIIRRLFFAELYIWLLMILIVGFQAATLYDWWGTGQLINFSRLQVRETPENSLISGKKLLVVGEDLNLYQNCTLATPYLNWELSKRQLGEFNYYDNLTEIFLNLEQDSPEVIVDREGIVPRLFRRLPTIATNYALTAEGIYVLRQ